MGLFSLNSMDATDMSRLAGYCALMMVLCQHYEGYWPGSERFEYMREWLKKAKHRAPIYTRRELGEVAETVARRYHEEHPEELARLIESKDEALSQQLMDACRAEMDARGIS